MLRKLAILVCLVLVAGVVHAGEWYSISATGVCDAHDPTTFVKEIKNQGEQYTESNVVKEGGKIVSVKIVHEAYGYNLTYHFYRGLKRCKSAWAKLKRESAAEENKYR